MFNVHIAQSLISHITFLLAYLISITFAGSFTAWVAQKMGDDTPADYGFLSLNPIIHIDFFGLIFLMLYNFGWGKFIPRNPANITGRFRYLKIFMEFIARSLGYALIGMIALILLIVLFGGQILTTPYSPMQAFPETSSYTIALSFILLSMLYVDMMLAAVSFLVDMCGMVLALFLEEYPEYAVYASLIMMIVPVILFIWFFISHFYFWIDSKLRLWNSALITSLLKADMKKLLLCAGLLNFFNVYAMEEDEAFEGMISFYEAYLSSRLIYFNNGTVSCVHYVKGSQQPYVLSSKNVASHLENAKEQICKMYEDGRLRQIENLLSKGQPLNLYGQLALVLQSVHQFHVNADLDDSHTSIKKNREMYRNAWNTQDALDIALASRLPLYPQGEGHIPLTRKIEQLKEELGKQ